VENPVKRPGGRQRGQALSAALFSSWRICLLVFLLVACGPAEPATPPAPESPASHQDLASHYAPLIHQGVASEQDYITAVDFDGDWIGNNNWQNQPASDLAAYVYYSVIETETHWFLFYSLFHPRDYTAEPCAESNGCHENDMESLQLVVAKDGSAWGQPVALETLAHSHIYLYRFDDSVKKGALRVQKRATLEEGHPVVWVETYGHGIYGQPLGLKPAQIVYRPSVAAGRPQGQADEQVSYRLVPIYDTLWQHRDEMGPGKPFDRPFSYSPHHILPATFDGDDYGLDRANTPWGYDQETGDTLSRGDWFLDPARALASHATIKGEFSSHYLYNPYLVDLGLLEEP